MKLKTLVVMLMCMVALPMRGAYANGTVKMTLEPKVFYVTYTPGRPLAGNAEFTPSVWHEDQPSGPFGDCSKANSVTIRVQKLFYPFKFPASSSEWMNPNWADYQEPFYYHIGSPGGDGLYPGLCVFTPLAMKMWDYSKSYRVPNSAITADEAASFCSKPENQGRRHSIKKLVYAKVSHANYKVGDQLAYEIIDVNLACDCSPLYLKDSGNTAIYRTDNQKVKRTLLTIGSSSMVLPLKATVSSGQIPPGLTMKLSPDSKELYLEGVPETEGYFKFTVKIKDSCPLEREETVDFNISVGCGTMKFKTLQKLPDAVLKKPYEAAIETTCNAAYSNVRYELLGELPPGLAMSPSGKITGTPTEEKETYFYVSATGRENGAAKEIHQRFDLVVAREIQVIPGVIKPEAVDEPGTSLSNTPEITGVPQTCHPGEALTVSYRGLKPQLGAKMGLFGEKETGSKPAQGWKTLAGSSGTLNFTAPTDRGRYVFRIVNAGGTVTVSGKIFTVVTPVSAAIPASAGSSMNADTALAGKNDRNSGRLGTVDAQNMAKDLRPKTITPETSCEDSILFPDMPGYAIAECVKRFDEAVILLNGNPESSENPRYEGEKISVTYEWQGDGPSPSELKVRRTYAKEAKKLGGTVLVDRNRFTAFTLNSQGRSIHASVDVYNDGRTVVLTVIEPETPDDVEKAGQ